MSFPAGPVNPQLATLILIDAENMPVASWMLVDRVVEMLDGPYSVRLYGNKARLDARWLKVAGMREDVRVVQTRQGKNQADLRMTAEGLVQAATTGCRRVVVCSSDGDFIHLLEGARALGCQTVLVSYERPSTGRMRAAADLFIPYREDVGWPGWAERMAPAVRSVLSGLEPGPDGSYLVALGDLGTGLRLHAPWFQPKLLGFRSLSRMMAAFPHTRLASADGGEPAGNGALHVRIAPEVLSADHAVVPDAFRIRIRAAGNRR